MTTAEKIKERLGIEEVLSSYISFERAGKNLKAKCPFHTEKTASFFISPDRGTYYCFGCGAKGDIFSFVEKFEGLDFKGALRVLAERAGISLEASDPNEDKERKEIFDAVEEATKYFEKELPKNGEVIKYLTGRGLNKD